MKKKINKNTVEIKFGDSLELMKKMPDNSVNLIITSPPYANQRSSTYGGINHDKYVEWFLPFTQEMLRILNPLGTFVLNIRENAVDGEIHTYVLELILAMKKQGWLWTEEFIWHKTTSMPGKWVNRFRNAWERCLQFNKQKKFAMYQDEVKVPIGDWAETRMKNLSENDKKRSESDTGSGFGRNISNWIDKKTVYPSNVLHFAPECGNKKHSAVFPKALPEFFIKLFTKEDDLVFDPFAGSGTSLFAALELKRDSVGIELKQEYFDKIEEKIKMLYN